MARLFGSTGLVPMLCSACRMQSVLRSAAPPLYSGVHAFGFQSIPEHRPAQRQERGFRGCSPIAMGRRSAKIATRKEKSDGQKAKLYGKLGKLIAQAARAGGPNPVVNERLRDVLHQAKLASLPNNIMTRNLEKASDKAAGGFTEVVYECYGPGGTGYLIESLTDNTNRAASTVRATVARAGGKMADPGSVLFAFARRGIVLVEGPGEDAVLEAALEAGASDVVPMEEEEARAGSAAQTFRVLTEPTDFAHVCGRLAEAGLTVDGGASGLGYVPVNEVEVDDDDVFAANETLFQKLLAVEDVDAVYSNCAGLSE